VGGLAAYQSQQAGRSQSPFSGNATKVTNPVQLRTKVKETSSGIIKLKSTTLKYLSRRFNKDNTVVRPNDQRNLGNWL
jgi:hypothetical protein